MVNALIKLDENTNRVLNIVKAKYGLKDKSEAIQLVVKEYVEIEDELELRPDFIEKMKKIMKEKPVHIGSLENFGKKYGIE